MLWLGDDAPPAPAMLWLHARADLPDRPICRVGPALRGVGATNGDAIEALWDEIVDARRTLIPKPGELALNARQAGTLP